MATRLAGLESIGLRSLEHSREKSMHKTSKIPTVESLKRALVKAWDEISVDTLRKIVDDFPKRLKACVEADGGHIE
uniref:Transposase n=1 Tax=Acrobeloides nanus TaxID=290746 RepID=A0A914EIE7_9BILA